MTVSAATESFELRSDFASRTYLPTVSITSAGAESTLARGQYSSAARLCKSERPLPSGYARHLPERGGPHALYAVVARSSDSSSSGWRRPGRLAEKAFFMWM